MASEAGANIPPIKVYPDKFSGQVVIVTGGAQGIGFATAQLFADQGAQVVLFDIQEDKLKQAHSQLEARNGKASCRVCDITKEQSVQEAIDWVISTFYKIDVLANIAGIYPSSPLANTTAETYHLVMSVNVDASFFLSRAVLPHMKKAGYGRIIHTSSSTFQEPEQGCTVYIASKAAVIGLVRGISAEASPGVTANVVMPGLVNTPTIWNAGVQPDGTHPLFDGVMKKQDIKRWGRPEDIAHAFSFVASPEASFVSGQVLDVSGGETYH